MHTGANSCPNACPSCCMDAAKLSWQIGNTRPCAPNCLTNSAVRTPGSAKLVSLAVHACAITGHGQEAAPQELSFVLGAFHVTTYGVAAPWIDATNSCAGSALRFLSRFAASTTLSRYPSESF